MLLLVAPTFGAASQQATSSAASDSEAMKTGRRLYERRCSVCHTIPGPRRYAPILHQELVKGRESAARQYIMNGSRRMPGFKHALQPADVDAMIEYLKTVPKPSDTDGDVLGTDVE